MTELTAIEAEVLKATGVKVRPGNDMQFYLKKVANSVDGLDDDVWDTLTKPAMKWCNSAVSALKKDTEIPDFPDRPATDQPSENQDDDADDEAVEVEAAAKKEKAIMRKKKKVAVTAAAAPKQKAKSAKSSNGAAHGNGGGSIFTSGKLPSGAPTVIMQLLIKDPNMDKDELQLALNKKGIKSSMATIVTQRNSFRSALRVLNHAGKLSGIDL